MRKIINKKSIPTLPPVRQIAERIAAGEKSVTLAGLSGSARAFAAALLFDRIGKPCVAVCPTEKEAAAFARDLALFLGDEAVLYYPPLDFLSIDMFALQREEELSRLSALTRFQTAPDSILVTCAAAWMQKIMPRAEFASYLKILSTGDLLISDETAALLVAGGYRRVALVEEEGEFSMRGNILDVFPPSEAMPLRLELSGDEIESIRRFDSATQRSHGAADAFILGPAAEILITSERLARAVRNVRRRAEELDLAREVRNRLVETLKQQTAASINPVFLPLFYEDFDDPDRCRSRTLSSLHEYLSADTLLILDDPQAIRQAAAGVYANIDKMLFKAKAGGKFYLEGDCLNLGDAALEASLESFHAVRLAGLLIDSETAQPPLTLTGGPEPPPAAPEADEIREESLLRQTAFKVKDRLAAGGRVFLISPTPEDALRMRHLLSAYDLPITPVDTSTPLLCALSEPLDTPTLQIATGRLSGGFVLPEAKLTVLGEEELFVRKAPKRRVRPKHEGYFLKSFGDLKEGDFVVHTDFGIGRYRGLQKISVGNIENDFVVIEYADGDKLYLPVNALDKIQRYLGPEGYTPRIDKMGGASWDAVKERVRESVRDVAEELVAIYAAREAMERNAFAPPDRVYEEFCSTFEFEETHDQARAIEDIHADMDDIKPMDRLICGDAGFGKTEVALRAAFRAVMDGKQVALLAPTTILVEQHFATFCRRLADFPVRVEALNRFKNAAQIKKTLADLQAGLVDIAVGTHRLLQKDVAFKNLGLVIIDEEQRFGVAHKEKLKKMRTLVDVLTLSATPIPRTLHLSLVGIRDLSIINTPPQERRPIKTYVLEFDEDTLRQAVENELDRGGQVFVVHDRVRSIYSIAHLVQRLVPKAKVGVVHGQMKPADIEKTMSGFIRREFDVLVCTTIIGSGLDIPSANTIIINRADRFGLAQLYQIRGRVGRGSAEALAYLMLPKGAMLSRDAMKRLSAIKEFSEPGSGFRIAYNDLEIRGGGNLLGLSQAGHISAVGYELYTELMEKTVREIKGETPPVEEVMPEIQMGISAYLPETYVEDIHQRLILYKRISLAGADEDIDDLDRELADCYGPPPAEAKNLLGVIRLRNAAKSLGAKKMGYDGKFFYLYFRPSSRVDPGRLLELSRKEYKDLRLTPDHKLFVPAKSGTPEAILDEGLALLKGLAQ